MLALALLPFTLTPATIPDLWRHWYTWLRVEGVEIDPDFLDQSIKEHQTWHRAEGSHNALDSEPCPLSPDCKNPGVLPQAAHLAHSGRRGDGAPFADVAG